MVIIYSRVWINRVRLPILLVVSWTGKITSPLSPFAPKNLVGRDGFGRPVLRQPAHSPHSGWIWCLLTGFLPISAAASIYLFKPPYAIGSVPSLSGQTIAYRWRSLPRVRRHRASNPHGSSSNGCCFCITMDHLMCASLFPHPLLILVWSMKYEVVILTPLVLERAQQAVDRRFIFQPWSGSEMRSPSTAPSQTKSSPRIRLSKDLPWTNQLCSSLDFTMTFQKNVVQH